MPDDFLHPQYVYVSAELPPDLRERAHLGKSKSFMQRVRSWIRLRDSCYCPMHVLACKQSKELTVQCSTDSLARCSRTTVHSYFDSGLIAVFTPEPSARGVPQDFPPILFSNKRAIAMRLRMIAEPSTTLLRREPNPRGIHKVLIFSITILYAIPAKYAKAQL